MIRASRRRLNIALFRRSGPRWAPVRRFSSRDDDDKSVSDELSHVPVVQGKSGVLDARYTPDQVVVIPLYRRPLFPGTLTPIMIHGNDFIRALQRVAESHAPYVGVFLVHDENGDKAVTDIDQIHSVGVLAAVSSISREKDAQSPLNNPPGATASAVLQRDQADHGDSARAWMYVSGMRRIKLTDRIPDQEWLTVGIEALEDEMVDPNDPELRAYHKEVLQTMKDVMSAIQTPLFRELLSSLLQQLNPSMPAQLADISACVTSAPAASLQGVLEALDIKERQRRALVLLKEEIKIVEFQRKLNKDIEEKVQKQQQKFFLNEQMKAIKRELGLETDEKEQLLEKFRKRLAGLQVPENVQKTIDEEMQKLSMTEPASTEFAVTRNYLDWLTQLPWGVRGTDNLSLDHATEVLDADHYGLKDIKERILEFIAVGSLRGIVHGKILCIVGPPGVGKTSIGKSIARALDRKFFRFSVGGLSDVAEIKGHRRTYVGSMPGKLIQCLKQVGVENPVVLIDEIDKMNRGHNGDPASALLEVLDPEQNSSFTDHYLDVPYDLSRVLFICTANVTDTIPAPLLDRMEVLRLSGYVTDEKVEIAKTYLLPAALNDAGLKKSQLSLNLGALRALTTKYCREAGVRSLQQHIERIARKAALRIVREKENKVTVTEDSLQEFVGMPKFTTDRYYARPPAGVVMGLAWTSMGGATLYVEVLAERYGKGNALTVSGSVGDVMRESAQLAHQYAKMFIGQEMPDNDFFEKHSVFMHIPEGATPKDGPSAGVTMITAMMSLAMDKPVKANLAMSGEVTLTGKVLPVGGIKEKTISARRSGVKTLIFPEENRKDWDELDNSITAGLDVHFCDYYAEVFELAFVNRRK